MMLLDGFPSNKSCHHRWQYIARTRGACRSDLDTYNFSITTIGIIVITYYYSTILTSSIVIALMAVIISITIISITTLITIIISTILSVSTISIAILLSLLLLFLLLLKNRCQSSGKAGRHAGTILGSLRFVYDSRSLAFGQAFDLAVYSMACRFRWQVCALNGCKAKLRAQCSIQSQVRGAWVFALRSVSPGLLLYGSLLYDTEIEDGQHRVRPVLWFECMELNAGWKVMGSTCPPQGKIMGKLVGHPRGLAPFVFGKSC